MSVVRGIRVAVLAAVAGCTLAAGTTAEDPLFDEACEGLNAGLDICTGDIRAVVEVDASGAPRLRALETSLTVAGDLADRDLTDHYRIRWQVDDCVHLVSYDFVVERAAWVGTLFERCGEAYALTELPGASVTVSGRTVTWWIGATDLATTTVAYAPGTRLTAAQALTQSGVTTWNAGELMRTVDTAAGRRDVVIGDGG